jgi:simple sugar transport system permease protein
MEGLVNLPVAVAIQVGFVSGLLDATTKAATPLILAGLGEIVAERAGVLNLGVEGIMLMSALTSFAVSVWTGSLFLGFGAGVLVGMVAGGLLAFLSVTLKADQVISGLMITLLGTALTNFFGGAWMDRRAPGLSDTYLPVVGRLLADIPIVGEALFHTTVTDYIAIALVPVVWYGLFRTNLGREIIAVGEDPETADTLGIPVFRLRYGATIFGSALAGLAGSHLVLAWIGQWSTGMTSGLGWIALALVIVSRWRPLFLFGIAYAFAMIEAMEIRLQAVEIDGGPIVQVLTEPTLFAMYPFIATIVVLAWSSSRETGDRLGNPTAITIPYTREE